MAEIPRQDNQEPQRKNPWEVLGVNEGTLDSQELDKAYKEKIKTASTPQERQEIFSAWSEMTQIGEQKKDYPKALKALSESTRAEFKEKDNPDFAKFVNTITPFILASGVAAGALIYAMRSSSQPETLQKPSAKAAEDSKNYAK